MPVGAGGAHHRRRVMPASRFRRIAQEAGWSDIEILPIDHPFWRFYRLVG
jgi:hypothetical protein